MAEKATPPNPSDESLSFEDSLDALLRSTASPATHAPVAPVDQAEVEDPAPTPVETEVAAASESETEPPTPTTEAQTPTDASNEPASEGATQAAGAPGANDAKPSEEEPADLESQLDALIGAAAKAQTPPTSARATALVREGGTSPAASDADSDALLGQQLEDLLNGGDSTAPSDEQAPDSVDPAQPSQQDQPLEALDAELSQEADQAVADAWETPADAADAEVQAQAAGALAEPDETELDLNAPAEAIPESPSALEATDEAADQAPEGVVVGASEQPTEDALDGSSEVDDEFVAANPPVSSLDEIEDPPAAQTPVKPAAKPKRGPVSATSLIAGFKSSAKQVADELDETGISAGDAQGADADASQGESAERPASRLGAKLAPMLDGVVRVCALVNKPMNMLSPQLRSIVGYVGLITIFNGLVLIVLALTRSE